MNWALAASSLAYIDVMGFVTVKQSKQYEKFRILILIA
jgi:hypothetical protein